MSKRRLDIIDIIFRNDLHWLKNNADAEWDEAAQCFWITVNSPTDTWLKVMNL